MIVNSTHFLETAAHEPSFVIYALATVCINDVFALEHPLRRHNILRLLPGHELPCAVFGERLELRVDGSLAGLRFLPLRGTAVVQEVLGDHGCEC